MKLDEFIKKVILELKGFGIEEAGFNVVINEYGLVGKGEGTKVTFTIKIINDEK